MLVSNDPEINKAVHDVTVKAGTLGKTWGMKWEDNRQEIVSGYRKSLSTRSGLAANMHQPQGPLKYSFADYLSGKGDKKYNAQIWSALKEAGVDVPKDKDGDGKITEKDFATAENGIAMIKRLTQIDEDGFDLAGTKNIVSEFLADHVGKKEFDDNRRVLNKPNLKGNNNLPDSTETDNLGVPDYTYPRFGSGKVDSYDARTLKRRLLDGTGFNFNPTGDQNDSRSYDFIGGSWYENYEDENNKGVNVGSADDMVLNVFKTNHEAFQGLSTSVPEETINIEGETTDATTEKDLHTDIFNKLDLNKDNAVSTALNDYFDLSGKRKTLQFRPYTGLAADDALRRSMGADAIYTNDIMLYNPQTGKRITDNNGDVIRFKIGDDMANLDGGTGLSKDVARILEVLKQNGVQPPTQLP